MGIVVNTRVIVREEVRRMEGNIGEAAEEKFALVGIETFGLDLEMCFDSVCMWMHLCETRPATGDQSRRV